MPGYDDITREIEDGPAGPEVGAFFDLDRTLISGFSVVPLVFDGLLSGRIGPAGLALTTVAGLRFQLGQIGFSGLVTEAAGLLKGENETAMLEVGERLYADRLAAEVYPEARAIVRAHRRRGHTMAVVSSATRYQIEPLAQDLGIEHVLCTRLEVRDGRFTGGVTEPLCYGEGKLEAARELATTRGVDLAESFFYTDSDEDLPLLEHVGRPRPTNPNRRLATIAARRGWPARTFRTRGLPGVMDVVRTSLSVASIGPSLLLGVPAGVLEGSWRQVINLAATTWGELGSALAGIRVSVTGEEHLWSHRPAVFIFNHQSAVDVLILCKLLHRDFVGISKQEVRRNPIFGPVFALAGTVFIDRSDRTKAIEAMQPAVRGAPRRSVHRHRARGYAQQHRQAGTVQEGRVSHRAGGAPADRADRHPQRAGRAAQARHHRATRDGRRRGASAHRHRRVVPRHAGSRDRGDRAALPRHPASMVKLMFLCRRRPELTPAQYVGSVAARPRAARAASSCDDAWLRGQPGRAGRDGRGGARQHRRAVVREPAPTSSIGSTMGPRGAPRSKATSRASSLAPTRT